MPRERGDTSTSDPFNNGATGNRFLKQYYLIFYAQDEWKIRPNLTMSYGLRYEYLAYPALDPNAPLPDSRRVRNDAANWAPRFGFAWRTDSKTVVRGGFGVFYDTLNLRLLSQVIRQNGSNVLSYTITSATPGAPGSLEMAARLGA